MFGLCPVRLSALKVVDSCGFNGDILSFFLQRNRGTVAVSQVFGAPEVGQGGDDFVPNGSELQGIRDLSSIFLLLAPLGGAALSACCVEA